MFQKNSKKDRKMCAELSLILRLWREGTLFSALDEYLALCHTACAEHSEKPRAKVKTVFPNIAGFCRFLGTGMSDILVLKAECPLEYDRLLAVFEDEALNSDISPTLLSAYMKKRMQYAVEDAPKQIGEEVRYCFEHDIFADGE